LKYDVIVIGLGTSTIGSIRHEGVTPAWWENLKYVRPQGR